MTAVRLSRSECLALRVAVACAVSQLVRLVSVEPESYDGATALLAALYTADDKLGAAVGYVDEPAPVRL